MDIRTVKLQVRELPGEKKIKLVEIDGALDTITVAEAEKVFSSLVNEEGESIIVDCAKLTYINTVGLILFMKYYIKTKRRNSSLKLINLKENIYEIMDISGALKLLEVYKTKQEALDSLKQ